MLTRKLHLKAGMCIAVVNAPAGFSLDGMAGVMVGKSLARDLDLVLLFVTRQQQLKRQWSLLLAAVKPGGALWVAYPKQSSGIPTDLGMGEWDATRGSDWHPVAMIAVDDAWSATRFKYAPGLEKTRDARQSETINDTDGTVCVDRVKRIVTAPKDLQTLLASNVKARVAFDRLSFTNLKEYVVWILEAKKPETRTARITKTIEMLSNGKKNPSDK